MAKLGEVCKLNMGQSPDSSSYNDTGDGIPFFQGNADFGEIHPNIRVWCNAPTKIAHPGEILISVRAPIGAMNIADCECCIGRGLASISADEAICTTKYLWYVISSKIEELNAKGTGSTFKAVNKKTLEETEIPIRDLSEQERIAAYLDRVTALISLRKRQLRKLDELVKARFVEMFGDPVKNTMDWEIKPLSELGELNRGVSKARPRNSPELLGGPYPLIQTGEVANAKTYITSFNSTYSEKGLAQSKMWPKGTLCITIAANIAQTSILTFDACFPDSVVGFISRNMTNELFIHYWFSFFQKILNEQAPQVAQKNINLKILSELNVIVPPLSLQNRFAAFVERVDQQKQTVQQSLEKLELMKKALMQEYFG